MSFLTIQELDTVSVESVRNMITHFTDAIIEQIIAESIDLMKSYLLNYYDVEQVFNATGTARSLIILKYLKNIVIYELYARDPQNQMNEVVKLQYDEALLWLTNVSKGRLQLNLPRINNDTNGDGVNDDGFLWLKSNQKYSNDY